MEPMHEQVLSEAKIYHGTIDAVLVGDQEETFITTRYPAINLAFDGVTNDHHRGHTRRSGAREKPDYQKGTEIWNFRQITITSTEELAAIAQTMGIENIDPELIGANICVSGIKDLTSLPSMTKLVFPRTGAVIRIFGENTPCIVPGKAIATNNPDTTAPAFVKAALGKRGLIAWVECPGEIAAGDAVVVYVPEQRAYNPA